MNIWLKELSMDDGKEYLDVLMTLSRYPDVFARPVPFEPDEEDFDEKRFKSFLKVRRELKEGINLPKNRTPVSTYWVMADDKPIGYATLNHVADLTKPGGHLGCCLLKEYQNKGIGSIVADELSKIAYEELGINDIIYTSKMENIQSQRSLEKIGATLVDEHDGYKYYTVNLKEKYEKGKGR